VVLLPKPRTFLPISPQTQIRPVQSGHWRPQCVYSTETLWLSPPHTMQLSHKRLLQPQQHSIKQSSSAAKSAYKSANATYQRPRSLVEPVSAVGTETATTQASAAAAAAPSRDVVSDTRLLSTSTPVNSAMARCLKAAPTCSCAEHCSMLAPIVCRMPLTLYGLPHGRPPKHWSMQSPCTAAYIGFAYTQVAWPVSASRRAGCPELTLVCAGAIQHIFLRTDVLRLQMLLLLVLLVLADCRHPASCHGTSFEEAAARV
jgi:hypothetical protein